MQRLPGRRGFDVNLVRRVSGRRNPLAAALLIALGVGASLVTLPRDAQANCDVTQPSQFLFTCAQNTTTIGGGFVALTPGSTNVSSFFSNGNVGVDIRINPGVTVGGSGLNFSMIAQTPETIINQGTVSNTFVNAAPGLRFFNGGSGAVSYAGNGSVYSSLGDGLFVGAATSVQFGSAATPVVPTYVSPTIALNVSGNSVAAYLNAGSINGGLSTFQLSSTPGTLSLTGHTDISTGLTKTGIATFGAFTIDSDANIGDANHRVGTGIAALPNVSGPISVTHGAGGSIFANTYGIEALGSSSQASVSVTNNGTISASGGTGILAAIQSAPGNITIHHNGTITTVPDNPTITTTQTGILALAQQAGDVAISVNGNITTSAAATSIGVNAGALSGNLTIDVASGATISAGGIGIQAVALGGTGTVNVLGTVSGGFAAKFIGTMNVGNGGTTGTIIGDVFARGVLNFNRSDAITYAGIISGSPGTLVNATVIPSPTPGIVQQNGSGTLTLTGISSYAGATNVNAGTLIVDGSIASSILTTVKAGATLGGNGSIGTTIINADGTLAPGSAAGAFGPLTVQGNLSFAAASSYMIQVSPANAGRTDVTGTATLGGAAVTANFAAGSYISKQYTIINATGGVSGTFGPVATTNLPSNFTTSLGYDANHAFLNLTLVFSVPGGLNGNQQNLGNALTHFFNSTGGIPITFAALSPAGLTQAAGETATGSQQTTFSAMTQFISTLLDPFIAGRGDASAPAGAIPFAEDNNANANASAGRNRSGAEREAYAAIYNKAPPRNPLFDPRWSVWSAGFGGSQSTDGNGNAGSGNTISSLGGVAVGADYLFSPQTIAGFALAGGGTQFTVANGGSGRSDLFQAGVFVRHTMGQAYIAGALAYGWQDITTDRTVTIAGVDQLRARFNANALSGRIEGGYRFVMPWNGFGLTPYAAGQFTVFDLPAYTEQVVSGANTFALGYAAKNVTATRSELGVRSDKSFAIQDAILTLRGRLSWAHDYNNDRSIGATFQTLPGASFVVNGAAQASDAALITGSAEVKWRNGFSLAGTFDSEFSNITRSYAGKAVARYTW